MGRHCATFSLFLLGIATGGGRADDMELKATVEKAWQGGGAEKLKAVKAWSLTLEGKQLEGESKGEYTTTQHVQLPDRYRGEVLSKDGEKSIRLTVVNGDKGWMKSDGKVTELTEREVADIIGDLRYAGFQRVLALNDPNFTLERLPEGKVAEKATRVVRVKPKTGPSEVLHIDKESGLIVMQDTSTRFARLETFFTDFKKVDGIPIAHTRTVIQNGKAVEERKISVKFVEKQDDKLFEKP